jgi:hypothetical protein
MESLAPNVKRQKALSPSLLRHLLVGTHPGVGNSAKDHAADLIIGAFFFAMRACEYVKTPVEGKTRLTTLGCVKFFTKSRVELSHSDTNLISKAKYVQIVFVDQKNGVRFEKRTQSKTKDPKLCPVLRFGRAVQRVLQFVPGANSGTPLYSTSAPPSLRSKFITSGATLDLVRETCRAHGGKDKFGFDPKDIGNKSLRSDHSTDKIMILRRWKSKAFLDYIRPQVIAWTGCFSEDMIGFDNFYELFSKQVKDPKGTELHGNCSLIPELNLKF